MLVSWALALDDDDDTVFIPVWSGSYTAPDFKPFQLTDSFGGGGGPYPQKIRIANLSQGEVHNKIDAFLNDPERKKAGLKLLDQLETIWEKDKICPNPHHPIFWCLSPAEVNDLNQIVGDGVPPYADEVEAALHEWARNGNESAINQILWLAEYGKEFEEIWSHFWKEIIEGE